MTRYTDINTKNDLLDQSLENYLIYGYQPGGFLTSVLANDLYAAATRADHWNRQRLPEIVNEIIYKVPVAAFGSYEAVEAWCRDKDNRRSEYARHMEKLFTIRSLKGEVREKNEYPF